MQVLSRKERINDKGEFVTKIEYVYEVWDSVGYCWLQCRRTDYIVEQNPEEFGRRMDEWYINYFREINRSRDVH